jgi:hypothetical protein
MDKTSNNRTQARIEPGSTTTRRSFVAAASLGAVSLYGLWAGLGAAPLRFWEPGESSGKPMDMAGHGSAQGPTPDEFRQMTEEFLARHMQPDGSILVEPEQAAQSMAGMTMTMTADAQGSTHAMPGMTDESIAHGGEVAPLDVFMLAQQWSFDPPELHLRTGIPYRFRMMRMVLRFNSAAAATSSVCRRAFSSRRNWFSPSPANTFSIAQSIAVRAINS